MHHIHNISVTPRKAARSDGNYPVSVDSAISSVISYLTVNSLRPSDAYIFGSDNGLSPVRRQAIIWTNDGILSIGPLGTNFSEILIKIHIFSLKNAFENVVWKVVATSSRPQCVKTWRPWRNGHHLQATFSYPILRIKLYILIHISLTFVPCGTKDDKSALVWGQVTTWAYDGPVQWRINASPGHSQWRWSRHQ